MNIFNRKSSIKNITKEYNKHFEKAPYFSKKSVEDEKIIDTLVYRNPNYKRNYDVIITAGMSLYDFSYPKDYKHQKWRTELILYVDKYTKEDILWMEWLSQLPFMDNFALDYNNTVKYHEPIYSNSELHNFLFLNPQVIYDQEIFNEPVILLWIVPITENEYWLKRDDGIDSLLDLFDKHKLSHILNRERKSLI